ncbi:MAG: dihydrofolate reductase family protein [Anaerolineales bacterium]|nr:dihydrofolate reductase family protein [Anaerolineales bacterium]
MRKVIYALNVSLDGFIEDVHGELGWSVPDEELHAHFNDKDRSYDLFLYGRRLYETMAAFWPTAEEDPDAPAYVIDYARIWKNKPKVVFSRTLDRVDWNSRLVRENIADEVNKLKSQPGGEMNVAGAELASVFSQLGLIDEYQLYIHPVILGGGKPMFGPLEDKINLELIETHTFGSGVVLLRYQCA